MEIHTWVEKTDNQIVSSIAEFKQKQQKNIFGIRELPIICPLRVHG